MTPDLETLLEQGAEARAGGLDESYCPLYAKAMMPGQTGESWAEWSPKANAWMRGWALEDAKRSR